MCENVKSETEKLGGKWQQNNKKNNRTQNTHKNCNKAVKTEMWEKMATTQN